MRRQKDLPVKAFNYLVMVLLLLLFLAPFAIALINSFKPLDQIILRPLAMPDHLQWENYLRAWEILNFPSALLNTTLITMAAVGLLVLLSAMSSYWITRHHFGAFVVIEKIITGTALVPFATIMLPLVLVIRSMGLINTHAAGILSYVGIGFPLAYLIMCGGVKAIPLDMDEAATIDGCSALRTFFSIIMPGMKATVVTVIISDIFWVWNEFQIALIFLNASKLRTIQLAINQMFGQFSTKWDIALPGLIISLLPILAVFLLLQRYVVAGVMSGAVKG
jgi:raffinose/stachyose/melibiose transport system permease protein